MLRTSHTESASAESRPAAEVTGARPLLRPAAACAASSDSRRGVAHGFTLLEVMLAMVVLATGALGVAKLQMVLFAQSESARQRTDGSHLAQQKVEQLRAFSRLEPDEGGVADDSFAALAGGRDEPSLNGATKARRSWSVSTASGGAASLDKPPFVHAHVDIDWRGRAGWPGRTSVHSIVGRADPADSALLQLDAKLDAPAEFRRSPGRRHHAIPAQAIMSAGNESMLRLAGGTLYFSNATGAIVKLCPLPGAGGAASATCIPLTAYLLSGYIRGNVGGSPGIRFDMTQYIVGIPQCSVLPPEGDPLSHTRERYSAYYCVVQPSDHNADPLDGRVWTGRVLLDDLPVGTTVCRYSPDIDTAVNALHPETYRLVDESLDNQNYVLDPTGICPIHSVLHQSA